MTETRSHLEVVDAPESNAPAAEAASGPPGPDRKLWIAGAVLAAGLLVCAGGWLVQAQESARLERSLAASEASLARTRADLTRANGRLAAFDSHLGAVRERVGALALELGSLGELLAAGPGGAGASEDAPRP